jgi:hypothetical protein
MSKKLKPIRIEGELAYVTLTKGYEAVIDAADAMIVGQYNWYVHVQPHTVYVRRLQRVGNCQKTVYLHRFLCGEPLGHEIDHIDCDALNNRRSNIRVATRQQNAHNLKPLKGTSCELKGVSFDKAKNKWKSGISVAGKYRNLGRFNTPEDAHLAYCRASKKYHGEFGRTS